MNNVETWAIKIRFQTKDDFWQGCFQQFAPQDDDKDVFDRRMKEPTVRFNLLNKISR